MQPNRASKYQAMRIPGFTLVELLVVIAIVATLSAVGIMGYMKARSKAASVKSLSNLRQIGVGLLAYGTDNQGKYPSAWDGSNNLTWRDKIGSYMDTDDSKEDSIFRSPTAKVKIPSSNNRAATYAMNSEMSWSLRQNGQDANQPPVSLLRVANPARVIVIADAGQNPNLGFSSHADFTSARGWPYWEPNPGPWLNEAIPVEPVNQGTGTEPGDSISYRDNNHAACLMADGHIERFAKGTIQRKNMVFFH